MAERDHATYTGTSLTSMDDALNNAWNQVPGGEAEGIRAADVTRMWMTGGGIVGTEYHVELTAIERQT